MFDFISFIPRAVVQGIPLLFGSTGETLSEKAGNLNLGIPGVMYVGGICGVIGSFLYEQSLPDKAMINGALAILIPLLCCLIGSLLMGLLYCFLTVTLRANQNVTGLALTTFGVGVGNFFGGSLIKLSGGAVPSIALSTTSSFFHASLPFAETFYGGRKVTGKRPAVFCNAYVAADGRKAIVLVNATAQPQPVDLYKGGQRVSLTLAADEIRLLK